MRQGEPRRRSFQTREEGAGGAGQDALLGRQGHVFTTLEQFAGVTPLGLWHPRKSADKREDCKEDRAVC